jgi:hypothetical protein
MLPDVSTIRWLGLRVHTLRDVIITITGPNYHDHETKPTKVNENTVLESGPYLGRPGTSIECSGVPPNPDSVATSPSASREAETVGGGGAVRARSGAITVVQLPIATIPMSNFPPPCV